MYQFHWSRNNGVQDVKEDFISAEVEIIILRHQRNHQLVLDKQIESHADSVLFFSWELNASHHCTVEIFKVDQRRGMLKKWIIASFFFFFMNSNFRNLVVDANLIPFMVFILKALWGIYSWHQACYMYTSTRRL